MAKRKNTKNTPIDLDIDPKQFRQTCEKHEAASIAGLLAIAAMFEGFGGGNEFRNILEGAAEVGRKELKKMQDASQALDAKEREQK